MAKNETRQLPASILAEDREIHASLKAITNYAPSNEAFTQAAIDASKVNMEQAEQAETQAAAAYEAARDNKVAAQWAFHNIILGGKIQVKAQFGENSNEVQSMKLKKKDEYKSPSRKKNGGDGGGGESSQ
jgi:hypothetical protein